MPAISGSGPQGAAGQARAGIRAILIGHARRYPLWTGPDVYKLVHQAALGSAHAGLDESAARAYLAAEIAGCGPGPEEPLVDEIAGGGRIVRVHLRPLVRAGLDSEALAAAFVRTAREVAGSNADLALAAAEALDLARAGALGPGAADLPAVYERMEAAGFPALHHSPEFQAAYRPAYRVVARQFLPAGSTAGA